MGKTIVIPDNREGFSMKVAGVRLNRPDLHQIAAEFGIAYGDVLFENQLLTIYNTSDASQEIVDDNAIAAFVAMAVEISPESISDITPVKAKPKTIEMDDFDEDDDD